MLEGTDQRLQGLAYLSLQLTNHRLTIIIIVIIIIFLKLISITSSLSDTPAI